MADPKTIFRDDPDAKVRWQIQDTTGQDLSGVPMVSIDGGPYDVAATWDGQLSDTRWLVVPVDGAQYGTGLHSVRLQVTDDADILVGQFYIEGA